MGGSATQLINLVVEFYRTSPGPPVVIAQFFGAKTNSFRQETCIPPSPFRSSGIGVISLLESDLRPPSSLDELGRITRQIPHCILPGFTLPDCCIHFNVGSSIFTRGRRFQNPALLPDRTAVSVNVFLDLLIPSSNVAPLPRSRWAYATFCPKRQRAARHKLMTSHSILTLKDPGYPASQNVLEVPALDRASRRISSVMYSISNVIMRAALNRFGTWILSPLGFAVTENWMRSSGW